MNGEENGNCREGSIRDLYPDRFFARYPYELMLYEERIISTITFIETLVGSVTTREEKMIRSFLNTFQVANLDTLVAEKSIEIRRTCRLKIPDAIIYATAKVNSCILVTRNTKDFKTGWPDVRIPYEY